MLLGVAAGGVIVTANTLAVAQGTTRSGVQVSTGMARFTKHDRARLVGLIEEGQPTASVLIAYAPHHGDTLVRRLIALGGRVRYQSDTLGYLRIDLPTARVLEAAAVPGIDAINLNGTQVYGASSAAAPRRSKAQRSGRSVSEPPAAVPADSTRWRVAPPDAATPRENPYLPMRDVGAPQFVAAHPTFDGRGTTIGSLECCPDFRHPVFQEPALTLDGKPSRKLAALYTVVADDSEATNRVQLRDSVEARHGRFTYEGVTYRASQDGWLRIGYYFGQTSVTPRAHWQADTLEPASRRRAAALDPRTGALWLDAWGDHDFTHEPPVHDYNATGEVGAFGRDDPATPWDDRVSFAVGVDTARRVVDVYPGTGAHITAVAGIAVGTHFYGGTATGAAPHARMVFVSEGGGWKAEGSHQSSRIEAMILLAQRPDVDIITTQEWYDMRLKDGGSVWSTIADRLVTTYHKTLFQSAGNEGGGLGSVGEAVNGHQVMKVGGSIDRDTWYTTFALLATRRDYLFKEASRGPHADGDMGPDFVAPMVQLVAQPTSTSRDSVIRINTGLFSARAIYRNPPGYTLQFGTSYTAPTAAGVAALLVSAARQTDTPVDPYRLRWALSAGARYFSDYQAYEQGAGILNVTAAWERLQRGPHPVEITVDAPVLTVLSPYLQTPGHGRGLYEREGWVAGDSATRPVTFTRTSGPAASLTYRLHWLGNDGTFSSPGSVQLDLNAPTVAPILVHPRTAGAHSALLQLMGDDGSTPAQQMSAVVVAAQQLDVAHQYAFTDHGHADWLGKTSYFVAVPPGAAALDLTLAAERGAVALFVFDPTGGQYPSAAPSFNGRHYGWPQDIAIGATRQQSCGEIRRTIEYPEPGVWEVVIEHDGSATPELRLKPQSAATFTFKASVTRITLGDRELQRAGQPEPTRLRAGNLPLRLVVRNEFASVIARVNGGPLASVAREELTLRRGGPAIVRNVVIDSGTTRLAVQLTQASGPAADVDVHLFDCTNGHCERHVSAVFQGAEKEVQVREPRPGHWRIVIDAYDVPSGVTTVQYREEIAHAKYGIATVRRPILRVGSRGEDTLLVAVQPGAQIEPGRVRALRLEASRTDKQTPSGRGPSSPHYPAGVLGVIRLDL